MLETLASNGVVFLKRRPTTDAHDTGDMALLTARPTRAQASHLPTVTNGNSTAEGCGQMVTSGVAPEATIPLVSAENAMNLGLVEGRCQGLSRPAAHVYVQPVVPLPTSNRQR